MLTLKEKKEQQKNFPVCSSLKVRLAEKQREMVRKQGHTGWEQEKETHGNVTKTSKAIDDKI